LRTKIRRFNFHLENPTPENCQAAIVVLLELYNLSSRLDVKNAALHVLDVQTQAVRMAEGVEGIDMARVKRILEKLEEKSKRLYSFRGQLGQHLKTHNFLNILKQIRFVDASNLEEKGKQIVEDVSFTLKLYSF